MGNAAFGLNLKKKKIPNLSEKDRFPYWHQLLISLEPTYLQISGLQIFSKIGGPKWPIEQK